MKTYQYRARSEAGAVVEGVIEANTEPEALSKLRAQSLIVSHIELSTSGKDLDLSIGGKAKEKALSIMCEQFSIILDAGLPIVRTIELIGSQTADKTLKRILGNVGSDVSAGYGMADSFAKYGASLPTTFIESVRAGEQSGNLDLVFKRLSEFYEKLSKTKGKVKSAMIYPLFVVIVAAVVIGIIMVFAVPTFSSTFIDMGVELPWVTLFMISVSNFFVNYWWVMLAIIVIIVLSIHIAKARSEKFRISWSRLGLRLPVVGRINLMSGASQYASTMSVMMEAGMPIVSAIRVTARSMSNYYLARQLESITVDLEAGKQLVSCLNAIDIFPALVNEMTGVGEQTGSLESTLKVLSYYYDNEVTIATERALSIMEPALILVLAIIVLGVLLAVYLPMFSLYGNFNSTL